MNKSVLRNTIRNKLKDKVNNKWLFLSYKDFLIKYRLLYFFKHLYKNYPKLQHAKIISIYYPLSYEMNCLLIAKWLTKFNILVTLPKIINNSRELCFYEFNKSTVLKTNFKEIKEPIGGNTFVPDALIVPLISFDAKGIRLGQGGGYYDYTINKIKKLKEAIVVGVAYSWQEIKNIPADKWDVKLDAIVTEKYYRFFNSVIN